MFTYSTSLIELAKAVNQLQKILKPVHKDASNPYFKSDYATLQADWEAVRQPLTQCGLSVLQPTFITAEGTVVLATMLLHTSGEFITGYYPLRPVKNDPQGYGSAMTYARRYTFEALLGMVTTKDDDGHDASTKRNATKENVDEKLPFENEADGDLIDEEAVEELRAAFKKAKWTKEMWTKYLDDMGLKDVHELNWFQGKHLLDVLKRFQT